MAGKGLVGRPDLFLLILSVTAYCSILPKTMSSISDTDALLEFKSTLVVGIGIGGGGALNNWTSGSVPCNGNRSNWGRTILCSNGGRVCGLKLENTGLSGTLHLDPLLNLSRLRSLSLMRNNLMGNVSDIWKLGALKSLYLSGNHFSGEIPDGIFDGMRSLKKLHLARNDFTGNIPSSISHLQKLLVLRLDRNHFRGLVPDLPQPRLKLVNVSYNDLEGKIPDGLSKMSPTSFQGNENLCGAPLDVECEILSPSSLPRPKRKTAALTIAVICFLALLAIVAVIFVILRRQRQRNIEGEEKVPQTPSSKDKEEDDVADVVHKLEQGTANDGGGKKASKKGGGEGGKLWFVRESTVDRFELQDLLRASAEVLGSGNFGSSYKAAIWSGPSVVVKRFKEMNGVGKEDFMEHMRRLGRLSHPNLLPLVAYYYSKEEKLLITNYIPNPSLAHMLHGNHGSSLPPLEWPTRLRIIKGVARGLAYLYEELPVLTLPHGNLKSSNVLLAGDNYDPLLTDYALVPVTSHSTVSQVMVAYNSPEVAQTGGPSKKSDVWSLGILILEIVTGKFPATYLQNEDLAAWVNSVVEDEWARVVFDNEMKVTQNGEGEMVKLLQIGLGCCHVDVNKRLEMKDALEKIEELKDNEG